MNLINRTMIKKLCKEHDRRIPGDVIKYIEDEVSKKVVNACKVYNGGKKTLDVSVLKYAGFFK